MLISLTNRTAAYAPGGAVARGRRSPASTATLALQAIHFMIQRRRQRTALRELAQSSERLLSDIGLTGEQALREADKPFWR